MKVRDIMTARQISRDVSSIRQPVPARSEPESWPCPKCGRSAVIESVEPSRDGERMLTFWHCEPCQSYAVTPNAIKEPPKGWTTKRKQ